MRNLYTHTDPTGPGYPAYVSLNVQDDGSVTLDVRSSGAAGSSHIVLDASKLFRLGKAMMVESFEENSTNPVQFAGLQGDKAFAARVVSRARALKHAAARWLAGEKA